MKKINPAVLILSVLMLVMFAAPAAAASNTTVIEADCMLPDIEIKVTVPTSAEVYINPVGIPVKVGNTMEDGQIITGPSCIENQSVVPVSVSVAAEALVKAGSDMTLVGASTKGSTLRSKRAFVYFEMKATSDPENVTWDRTYNAGKHLLVRESERIKNGIVTLGAGGSEKCYGAFRLTGDCIQNPREPWTEADGFDVTITFTFKPLPTTTIIP